MVWLSVFAVGIFVAAGFVAHAATLGVVVGDATPNIGQPVRVDIPLDTQGEDANAIQGKIIFPSAAFKLESIVDGDSPVSFWIDAPSEVASGVVAFSGIMPGGFTGRTNSVVSLILLPLASGPGSITFQNTELLRNDGTGSAISLSTSSVTLAVSSVVATSSAPGISASLTGPDPFTPVISHDPNIYDGQYFLAFSTTDKGSGIDHYEVLEGSTWQVATSPYLLQDQSLSSDIYVRAVDHSGNFIVVKVPAEHPQSILTPNGLIPFVEKYWWIIAILAIVAVGALIAFLLR